MAWSNAASAKAADTQIKLNTNASMLREFLLCSDIVAGTVIGYISLHLYYFVKYYPALSPNLCMMLWREMTLISVIGALVVARADIQLNNDVLSEVCATIIGTLGRVACAGILLLSVGFVTGTLHEVARLWLIVWACLFVCWMCLTRISLIGLRHYAVSTDKKAERIVVIGFHGAVSELLARLALNTRIIGVIDRSAGDDTGYAEALANVVSLARDGAVGLIILAIDYGDSLESVAHLVNYLRVAPARIALCATHTTAKTVGHRQPVMIAGVEMTIVANCPIGKRDLLIKSVIDRIGATLLLLLSLPLLTAIGIGILLETGGPVIFKQSRNGWCGRLFTLYKFRSMQHSPNQDLLHQTRREDPRCTRVGSFLRRTSLDELPQLWNILRGDMSLVGPRPHADLMHARERASYDLITDYTLRQRVKPGLTGWAQVNGLRGAADTSEKLRMRVEYDRYYIDNWSMWLDLKILAQTPLAVLSRENAF